ncbi:MAG: HypC/HybG/HupF family hydrogenase formation chaperone [Candidatus Methanomethylophilus sp.]|jgi:hydrogenase expression/formation protein HypC|nr:hydrogenase assembly chaperone HypC/HupF [methanogenic archaeon ISO4-H5]MBO5519457.1 HypC/HybG/HupF family hydrogenase formation chaperone [Methanomethylophilus sp.]MBO5599547.1 HypC/HybG/HupF family hydrogenase formation chaperone [Methanomethylophilus sp.]MEE3363510.1 HypC/HybG/HupF family hydrogenase formation chaperone [Methanomethylophilus sp.]
MCLAIPGKIVKIEGDQADIDFGGAMKTANVAMVDAKVGMWAVVHAGFAIELMDEEEALETLKLWNEFVDSGTAEIKNPN